LGHDGVVAFVGDYWGQVVDEAGQAAPCGVSGATNALPQDDQPIHGLLSVYGLHA